MNHRVFQLGGCYSMGSTVAEIQQGSAGSFENIFCWTELDIIRLRAGHEKRPAAAGVAVAGRRFRTAVLSILTDLPAPIIRQALLRYRAIATSWLWAAEDLCCSGRIS